MATTSNQPWIKNAKIDFVFILLPGIILLSLFLIFNNFFKEKTTEYIIWIALFAIFIDRSHVYATVFRFYWNRNLFKKFKLLLIFIQLFFMFFGYFLYLKSSFMYWRVLVYLTAFHFIRQNYGIMRLYSYRDIKIRYSKLIDSIAIYAATIYPIIFWHIYRSEKMGWYYAGDLVNLSFLKINFFQYTYITVIFFYFIKETVLSIKQGFLNIPKNVFIFSIYFCWYFGIVISKNEFEFYLINITTHGLPYFALVWIYGYKKNISAHIRHFPWKDIYIFFTCIFIFALTEAVLWDAFVFNKNPAVFSFFRQAASPPSWVVSILVPFLALPQITHYIIDGFIWKKSEMHSESENHL